MKRFVVIFLALAIVVVSYAQEVDYKVVSVNEESGIEFTKITTENDYVCMPQVKRTRSGISWFTNKILSLSPDGSGIAYLSWRNDASNIFVKSLNRQGGAVQRTNRQMVLDFSFSPDGSTLCFSEQRGNYVQMFTTNANAGYVCRQITTGAEDYSPVFSSDMGSSAKVRGDCRFLTIGCYQDHSIHLF